MLAIECVVAVTLVRLATLRAGFRLLCLTNIGVITVAAGTGRRRPIVRLHRP